MQCFNTAGATIMRADPHLREEQRRLLDERRTSSSTWLAQDRRPRQTACVAWRGCNGNGQDDGWAQTCTVTVDNATAPTKVDVQAARGRLALPARGALARLLHHAARDPNTAICTWTEGNTQPQRDGTWMAAIDISGQPRPARAAILWKQQIDGRKDAADGSRTYSMRAMHDRIALPDATGKLGRTDMIVWRSGDVRGNNNTNAKGGTYYGNNMAVIKADKAGMTYVIPLTDMSSKLLGIDGTHLGMTLGDVRYDRRAQARHRVPLR